MTDFTRMLAKCMEVNTVSAKVVDEFLMYYVAGKEGLERKWISVWPDIEMLQRDFSKAGSI